MIEGQTESNATVDGSTDVEPVEAPKPAVKLRYVRLEVDGCVVSTRIPMGKDFYPTFDEETGNLKGINWY